VGQIALPSGGRPPVTTHSQLARAAIDLFDRNGFDETTIDEIVESAGVGRRTFFRYFATKSSVLWYDFDDHLEHMRAVLVDTPRDLPMMSAIRDAVLGANDYGPADLPDLRVRLALIGTVPTLQASATLQFAYWEQVIADFVAGRTGLSGSSLYPSVVGRCVLAACRSAFDEWAAHGDEPLRRLLAEALGALEHGFDEDRLRADGRRFAARARARARRFAGTRG
jgi:mycofactocin system transcriptional regulator